MNWCQAVEVRSSTHLVDGWLVLEHVESDSLGKRSALSDSHDVTLSNVQEARGAVHWDISVSLLETSILWHVLQIITTNDDGSLHFRGDNHCLQNTTTDRNISGEGAFLVNIWSLNSLLGCFESKTDALVVSHASLSLLSQQSLLSNEDTILLLVSFLVLWEDFSG